MDVPKLHLRQFGQRVHVTIAAAVKLLSQRGAQRVQAALALVPYRLGGTATWDTAADAIAIRIRGNGHHHSTPLTPPAKKLHPLKLLAN